MSQLFRGLKENTQNNRDSYCAHVFEGKQLATVASTAIEYC